VLNELHQMMNHSAEPEFNYWEKKILVQTIPPSQLNFELLGSHIDINKDNSIFHLLQNII
jgi:hypothetical protein